jgi:putative ABC transport system ATP-binding protein
VAPTGILVNGGTPLIEFERVSKVYPHPAGNVVALDNVTLSIMTGEFVAIMGPSGSGKSTLLNLIGGLDVPSTGILKIEGADVSTLTDDQLTDLRRDRIGFIFQQFNLFPLLTAKENIEFPIMLACGKKECGERPRQLFSAVDLPEDSYERRPSELSGGQQQRVAIARALINDPALLLCDEPTGNLDTRTGTGIMELLLDMNRRGKTIVMVTHDPKIAGFAERTIHIRDGRVE